MKLSLVVTLLALSTGIVACGGASTSDVAPEDTAADEGALKTAGAQLSKDMVCAAVKTYNDNSDGGGWKSLAQKDLKGDALKDFKEFQKGMAGDYPSEAFEMPVDFKGKTYKFIMVTESNDGGMYMGIYKLNGDTVATMSCSESGTPNWSSPADKCPE